MLYTQNLDLRKELDYKILVRIFILESFKSKRFKINLGVRINLNLVPFVLLIALE